jgi:hypothetical protein
MILFLSYPCPKWSVVIPLGLGLPCGYRPTETIMFCTHVLLLLWRFSSLMDLVSFRRCDFKFPAEMTRAPDDEDPSATEDQGIASHFLSGSKPS